MQVKYASGTQNELLCSADEAEKIAMDSGEQLQKELAEAQQYYAEKIYAFPIIKQHIMGYTVGAVIRTKDFSRHYDLIGQAIYDLIHININKLRERGVI